MKLYTDEDGKLVKVEGDENNPVTQGRLCVRCLTLKDYIYNPSRILHPMKRDPKKRGDADAWEEISWDEAFALIKSEYDRITKEYGRESIVCSARRTIAIRNRGTRATCLAWRLPRICSGRHTPR